MCVIQIKKLRAKQIPQPFHVRVPVAFFADEPRIHFTNSVSRISAPNSVISVLYDTRAIVRDPMAARMIVKKAQNPESGKKYAHERVMRDAEANACDNLYGRTHPMSTPRTNR